MKEVHLICNAHIDPVWQWDWPEGVGAILSTFRSAAELADEFDYIFCHNEASAYRYVEVYAPDLFERIKQLVKKRNGISWADGISSPIVICLRAKVLSDRFWWDRNILRKNLG